jgi:hypothetical protein
MSTGVVSFGPYPSSPLSRFLTGQPTAVPIGTPEPPTGEGQFLLAIENQDDGARTEAEAEAVGPTTFVQITNFSTGRAIGTVDVPPCHVVYAVVDCLDRPIGVSCFFPDGTTQAVTVQASTRCFDRTFYITRDVIMIRIDEDEDGELDEEPVAISSFKISEANTNPRCASGIGGFGF